MAFRNSVKVTMLAPDQDAPRSYPTQSALFFEAPPVVEAPPEPQPEVAVEPTSSDAPPSAEESEEASAAMLWHARADELRAMTDTLPSEITRGLMPKIIALYDGFARAEGWSDRMLEQPEPPAPAAPPPTDELRYEDEPLYEDEFPDDDAPLALAPAVPAWLSFARRTLPSSRHRSIRR